MHVREGAVLCQRLLEVSPSFALCGRGLTLYRINVKLGGINTVPDARSVPVLTDPHNPTIVMG